MEIKPTELPVGQHARNAKEKQRAIDHARHNLADHVDATRRRLEHAEKGRARGDVVLGAGVEAARAELQAAIDRLAVHDAKFGAKP